jgi:hypothetical protein
MPATTRSQTGSLPETSANSTATRSRTTPQALERGRRIRIDESESFITNDTTWVKRKAIPNAPLEIPRFEIDLSRPPEERYVEICRVYQEEMKGLRGLFSDIVGGMVSFVPIGLLKLICWLFLRGLYNKEETEELRVCTISYVLSLDTDGHIRVSAQQLESRCIFSCA